MKWLKRILLALVVLLLLAQFVRPKFSNPPIDPAKEIQVPEPAAGIIARSCNDCHSNRTVLPWYSKIAPGSWLLSRDINVGRREMNFSEWATATPRRQAHKLQSICDEVVKSHDMPLWFYLPLHPRAKMTDAERQTLCDWAMAERARIIAAHPEAAAASPRR